MVRVSAPVFCCLFVVCVSLAWDPQLPLQLHSIITLYWPVPNYTAWLPKHMCKQLIPSHYSWKSNLLPLHRRCNVPTIRPTHLCWSNGWKIAPAMKRSQVWFPAVATWNHWNCILHMLWYLADDIMTCDWARNILNCGRILQWMAEGAGNWRDMWQTVSYRSHH